MDWVQHLWVIPIFSSWVVTNLRFPQNCSLKLSFFVTPWKHIHESGSVSPHVLNLGTRWVKWPPLPWTSYHRGSSFWVIWIEGLFVLEKRYLFSPNGIRNHDVQPIVTWFLEKLQWRSWLTHCATSRKDTGSVPDAAIGIFHSLNSSSRTLALGSTQHLT